MRIPFLLAVLGALLLPAIGAGAQTCFGNARFSSGPVRLGAGLISSEGAKSYGVDLAVGAAAGPFASGAVSRTKYSDIDGSATSFGVTLGYAIDVNSTRTVQVCPYLDLGHTSVPDIDVGLSMLESSADAVGLGGSIGGTVPVAPNLDVVPFVGATYAISRYWATLDGTTDSISERYGLIDVGVGFVINKVVTVQPQVSLPVGVEGAKSSFALSFAFSFGASKP
jgi:hypothetical protein